jgi:hypothetical protein
VCTEAGTVLRTVALDFFFNCWYLEILSGSSSNTYQGASTIMREVFDWKRSKISKLEVNYKCFRLVACIVERADTIKNAIL